MWTLPACRGGGAFVNNAVIGNSYWAPDNYYSWGFIGPSLGNKLQLDFSTNWEISIRYTVPCYYFKFTAPKSTGGSQCSDTGRVQCFHLWYNPT